MYKPIKANIFMIIIIILVATLTSNVKALNIKYNKNIDACIINKKEYSLEKNIEIKKDFKNISCTKYISDTENDEVSEEYNELVYIDNDIYYERAANYLTASKGVVYFEGHKETYYSEEALPGYGLRIPGRHVAYDGTIRDIDSYIVVAANSSYLAKGTIINTSLGLAKVYDTGCAYGTIDIYVNGYKFSTYKNINLLEI